MRKLLLLSLFAISFASLKAEGPPPNIVVNGNFATGNFTGWIEHTCESGCGDAGWSVESGAGPGGTGYAADTLCVSAPCNNPVSGDTIKQTLATDPSQL